MKEKKPHKKSWLYYYGIILLLLVVLNSFIFPALYNMSGKVQEVDYGTFLTMVDEGKVNQVDIENSKQITFNTKGDKNKVYITGQVNDPELVNRLYKAGVEFSQEIPQDDSPITDFILYWILPTILMIAVFNFMMKKMGNRIGGRGNMMQFGKSNAKVYVEAQTGKTFADVAGQDEAKESLTEIVDFLHNPKKYEEIGASMPKGALLVGPPGTGKTLIAKAVAGEAKVPFFSMSGSNFVEMFVGMGAAKVRDLFKEAEKHAPCIIFIDEIDSIGKSRDNQMQSNDEREQTLNQLLTEMDGFDATKGIVILGATNRPEILDKALLRPGRFDRRVIVDRPDLIGRKAILKVHSKDVKLADDVDLDSIAKGTPGAVGADLANMINEAAIRAVKHGRDEVIQEDLEEAVEVIIAGKEKKDRILSKQERKIVAFHEVGHALVAGLLEGTDPVHKITIVPRTMGALGYTMQLPEEEKYLVSKEEMLNQITVMLGGRAAEEVVFNMVSTGASNDIERATQSARSMVTVYGMTERFDMMALESIQNRYLDGRAVRNCSEETSTLVDEEILKIIRQCHNKAIELLTENRDLLDEISEYLLEKETIFGTDFERFIYNKYPELKKIKEKEKEENKLDLEKEENNDDHEAKEENHENHEDKENEVASTIDMIIE